MTKRSKVLAGVGLAVAGLLLASHASADVTVGVTNQGDCDPFKCNESGTSSGLAGDYQQFYAASAFTGSIAITGLTFTDYQDFNPGQPVLNGDYEVILGTALDAVGSQSLVALSNEQVFFNGALSGGNGDLTISGAAYTYDPSQGDLVVEVVVTNQDNVGPGNGNGYFDADTTGAVTSRAYNIPGLGEGGDSYGLVTTFDTGAIAPAPEPATWAFMLVGLGGLGGVLRTTRRKGLVAA